MDAPMSGEVCHIGGSQQTVRGVIQMLEELLSRRVLVGYVQNQKGDVRHNIG